MSDGAPPTLFLCADDFAVASDTSRVIANLLSSRRLTGTGCMTVRPNWPDDSRMLGDVPNDRAIGLHLVLTEEMPLTTMPRLAPTGELPRLHRLERLPVGRLPLGEITAEIDAQFQAFGQAMGRPPAFVDGHQHVHALPGIRAVVLAATRRHAPSAWLRTCEERIGAMVARPWRGKALASAFHSRGLRREAAGHGIATNRGFAGHYGFAGDYAALFPAFLRWSGSRHLVMCHPGTDGRHGDAIANARPVEAAALRSLPIAELAAAHGLTFG